MVKIPLIVLGVLRLTFGSNVGSYRCPLRVSMNLWDKIIPMTLMGVGSLFGFSVNRLHHPLLGRMLTLLPFRQYWASSAETIGELQRRIDKGWVSTTVLTLSTLSTSILAQYTPAIGVGLSALFLFYFYAKYCPREVKGSIGLKGSPT